MSVVVPTITTADQTQFVTALTKFQPFAKRIQVDTSDGTFAPTSLLPLTAMKFPSDVAIDLHLMTAAPSQYLAQVIALKPNLCIVHAEVTDNLPAVLQQLKAAGIKTGLALLKTTFPARVADLLKTVDHAMIFAGSLGAQGGQIDLMQIEKVPLLRAIKPELEIGWDGGVNLTNIRAVYHADVDVINVGSAITRASDPAAMYQSLLVEMEKKGVLI